MTKSLIIICFLTSLYVQALAGIEDYTFDRVSEEGGLTFGAIRKISQDSHGNIWLGTNYGLIRYNSQTFTRFEHIPDDTLSLIHNVITDIVIDKKNTLWVSTRIGLCYFNELAQTFSSFRLRVKQNGKNIANINSLDIDKNGNLWLVGSGTFGIVDTFNHELIELKPSNNEIPCIVYSDNFGQLWMGTLNGSVYTINLDLFNIKKIIQGESKKPLTLYVEEDKVWLGSDDGTLNLYSKQGALLRSFIFDKGDRGFSKGEAVRKVIKDRVGKVWVATYGGLYLQDGDDFIRFNPELHSGLANSSTYEIFEDKEGGIWIGTWSGGLSYYHLARNQFRNYSHSINSTSISSNDVSSFAQNSEGSIYVGTETGGLNYFDKKNGIFRKVSIGLQNKASIKSQCFDRYGGHWVGTLEQGLWYKAKGTSNYKNFFQGEEDGFHVSQEDIYSLFPVDTGIWIGTHGGGVNFYNFKTKRISFFKHKFTDKARYVRSLTVDSRSSLWLGTIDGLYRISLATGKEERFTSIPNTSYSMDYIFSVSELDNGQIWVGTRGSAIGIYDYSSGNFIHFDADGLIKGKDVYSIINDNMGNLWITVTGGLVYYNEKSKDKRLFTKADGIQGNWFTPQAVLKDKDNALYFGGTHGFSVVYPDKLKQNITPPDITINKILINNRISKYLYFNGKEPKPGVVELPHTENTIKIEFSSDNYLLPEKNKYKYRLINYYDLWIEAEQEASVLFVNLPWGEYQFEVKSCNNDGTWSISPARFKLVILKPFYATSLAITIYLLIFLGVIWLVYKNITSRAKLKKEIFEEKIQRKHEERLNEMKLQFFTNISHEFRTPLSLISGPVKHLSKADNLTNKQHELISVIWRNTSRLLMLIGQVIDLRKIEKEEVKLKLKKVDIIDYIKNLAYNFSNEAETKEIKFIEKYPPSPIYLLIDEEKLDKIIFNLLSNAFKYSDRGSTIQLEISNKEALSDFEYEDKISFGGFPHGDYVSICVSDTGKGIAKDELIRIFNRFEQGGQGDKKSSGIGLAICRKLTLLHNGQITVESSINKGSRFIVRLPIADNSEQLRDQDSSNTPAHTNEFNSTLQELNKIKATKEQSILIVDDNKDFLTYLDTILGEHFKVILAENANSCLELLNTHSIDLIVSDVMMPGTDGYELCSKIKNNLATSHIPIILLTALPSVNDKIIGIQKEADAYISKPFENELLIATIGSLLIQRHKLRLLFSPKAYTESSADTDDYTNYFLKKLNSIIEQNLTNEDFSIELLVQEIGISRSQLHRKLKALTSCSTSEYIRTYRLEKSIQIMREQKHNIDEISYMVGFNTHAYFTRSFKKHYGQSPKEYMKRMV
ncbi:MAG: two-component regulator propeller domain-containing protein [Bacteroidales bacterium]